MIENIKKNKKIIFICIVLVVITFIIYIVLSSKNKIIGESDTTNYKYLKKYDYNEFIPVYVTEEDMVKKYLNEYKNNMLFDIDEAWNNLNKEYREIRFGTIDKYKEYVENIMSLSIYSMDVDKYSVSRINGNKVFNIYDKSGNQYIIKEKSIMNFEVYLDESTVNIK